MKYLILLFILLSSFLNSSELQFTQEEKAYVDNNTFNVCPQYNNYPISAVKEGKLTGVMGDYFNEISKISKLKFEGIDPKSVQDLNELEIQGKCDLISIMGVNTPRFKNTVSAKPFIINDLIILSSTKTPIINVNDIENLKKLKIYVQFVGIKKITLKDYPQLDVIVENDLNKIIEKIKKDETTIFLTAKFVAHKVIEKYGFGVIKENSILRILTPSLTIGVKKGDELLLSIINKSINELEKTNTYQFISNKYQRLSYQINTTNYTYLWYALLAIAVLFIIVFLQYKNQKKIQEKQKQILKQKEQLKVYSDNLNKLLVESQKLNNKLNEESRQKKLAVKIATLGFWEYDLVNNILVWSDESYKIYGIDKNKNPASYEVFINVVHPDDRQIVEKAYSNSLINKEPYQIVHRVQMPDGTIKWVEEQCETIFDENDKPLESLGTVYDITAQKNALLEAQRLNEELSASEEELRASQEEILENQHQIESLAKAKEQFLANMSHEIRTPLNGIVGVVDMLFDEKDISQSSIDKLNILKKSSNILTNIVNDILDYSSLQTGNMKLYPKEFSLKEMLNHLHSTFENEFKEKNLKFNINVDSEVKDVIIADELRLSQILLNLLSNSKKFTEQGSVSLNIKSPYKNEKLQHLIIEVKDTGIGMSQDIKNNLFTPFTQGNQSNTKEYKGTGLGLTIVKKLVDIMGGQIDVYSMEDLGTTFKIKLKLEYSDKEIEHAKKDEIVILPQTKNALLVEDDEINQIVLRETLEKRNFKVDILENGLEAVNRLKEEHDYDIVFMDVQMPIMDGHEATRNIREFDKNIPIIALSAGVLPENIEQSLNAGMNMHIAKPIVLEELNSVLQKFI